MDLDRVLPILLVARQVRLLLDLESAVGEEGNRPAVRRKAGMPVVAGSDRQLSRLASPVERDEPDRVAIAVVAGTRGLDGQERGRAVGGQPWIRRDAEAVQVVGGERTRHKVLR